MPMFALVRRQVRDVVTRHRDRARVGPLEPGGDAQRRRLAASAGPEQADQLAVAQREVEALERDRLAERLADRAEE